MQTLTFQIHITVHPDDDGYYASVSGLKGCLSPGDTVEQALSNVCDAATAYLRSSIRHNDPIPLGFSGPPLPVSNLTFLRTISLSD